MATRSVGSPAKRDKASLTSCIKPATTIHDHRTTIHKHRDCEDSRSLAYIVAVYQRSCHKGLAIAHLNKPLHALHIHATPVERMSILSSLPFRLPLGAGSTASLSTGELSLRRPFTTRPTQNKKKEVKNNTCFALVTLVEHILYSSTCIAATSPECCLALAHRALRSADKCM